MGITIIGEAKPKEKLDKIMKDLEKYNKKTTELIRKVKGIIKGMK